MGFVLDRSDKDNQLWTDDLFSESSFKVLTGLESERVPFPMSWTMIIRDWKIVWVIRLS